MVIHNDLSKVSKCPRNGTCSFFAKTHSNITKNLTLYSFVIPLFHLIFHGELTSGLLFKLQSIIRVLFVKIQNGRH